jgi:hypothetical protein
MITHSALYWITRLDPLKSMFCGFSISFGIIGIALVIIGVIFKAIYLDKMAGEPEEVADKLNEKYVTRHAWMFRNGVKAVIGMFVLICINTLTPTMKEMAVIVVIPKVANSQPVHDIGEGIVNLAKDWMNELSPKSANKEEIANKVINTAEVAVKTVKKVDEIASKGDKATN